MTTEFNLVSFSLKDPRKRKCGDASFSGLLNINGEDCPVLIVADGVSQAPKDWLASESSVKFMVEYLEGTTNTLPICLQTAVEQTNQRIIDGVDDTNGMLSTLTVLVFQPSTDNVNWVNVGDSRLYAMKNSVWNQLSSDDSTSQPYMENGKMRLRNGQPIMVSALSRAIGYSDGLNVQVNELSALEFDAFLLCSDGYYGLAAFESKALQVYCSANPERMLIQVQKDIADEVTDDASMTLLAFAHNKADLDELLEGGGPHAANLPGFALTSRLSKELEIAITEQNEGRTDRFLEFMDTERIFLNRERMIQLLELMIEMKSHNQGKMIQMIKKLPIC